MSIISINGRAGHGKDLTGKIIQCLYYLHKNNIKVLTVLDLLNDKNLDLNLSGWQVKKFADKLKDIVCILIGCTREQLEDQDFKNTELGEEWNTKFYYITDNQGGILEKHYSIEEAKEFLPYWDDSITVNYPPEIEEVEQILTPRLLLQLLGTECGRDIIHPNIWVNSLMSEYKPTNLDENGLITAVNDYGIKVSVKPNPILFPEELIYPSWIITDMRFPNEMKAVKERNGITIRVVREHDIKIQRSGDPDDFDIEKFDNTNPKHVALKLGQLLNLHPSETALDNAKFDYEIINDGTIEDLIEKVKQILIKEKII
jgi:hypothetical protein